MRAVILLILFLTAISCLGCGPYEGPVLDGNDPKRLQPCQKPAHDDRAAISYEALTAVLIQNGWFIVAQAPETRIIDARKCKDKRFSRQKAKHPMERKNSDCLDIRFTISSSGAVTLINPPERRFYWKIEPNVHDWIDELELDYSQVRCYGTEDLSYWQQTSN